jgi:RNA polymerase sigma-70 factor, ECF subfamily
MSVQPLIGGAMATSLQNLTPFALVWRLTTQALESGGPLSAEGLLEHCQPWQSFATDRENRQLHGPPIVLSNDSRRAAPVAAATTISDEVLMGRYRGGDQAAFRELYGRYRGPLIRFVKRTAFDPSEGQEIIQETWMAVVRGRERYVPQARFVTYLFSIARRRGMDRWRRRGRLPETDDIDALGLVAAPSCMQPELLVAEEALAGAIAAAIEVLPLLQREVFLLRAETDLTLEEIAQVTGTTRETAKSRLRYGLNQLRAILEPWA